MQLQGSDEWKKARLGKVTASRIADVVAKTRTGYGASRANYMAELVAERLTGIPAPHFVSEAMQWGTETEPQARAAYAFLHNAEVTEVGFIPHPTIAMSGASPDGFVADDGLVEIKCVNTATMLDVLLGAKPDLRYIKQAQYQLAVTERRWCHLVYFDPRLPPEMQMHCSLIVRDGGMIAELEREATIFLSEIEDKVRILTERYLKRDAA